MTAEHDRIRAFRVEEALKAQSRGWQLLPLDGKAPIQKGWAAAPAPSTESVQQWAERGNIGLRTGAASGVSVIDDDSEDGGAAAALELPETVTVETGSGKRHYYFRSPAAGIGNSSGKLSPKIDVKGDGGQVVFVGSIHPDTGNPYKWAPGLSPDDVEVAEFPEHLLALLRAPSRSGSTPTDPERAIAAGWSTDAARRALADACAKVASAKEGSRNDTLNRQAFLIGRWVGAGVLDRADAENDLAAAAAAAGLDPNEIGPTVKSGIEAGISSPRDPLSPRPTAGGSDGGHGESRRPTIVVEGGLLPEIVTQAEEALLADDGDPVYQRGTMLVRAVRAPAITIRDVYRRAMGVLMLCVVEAAYLADRLTQAAAWFRPKKGDLVPIDCPERVARTLLARKGHWRVPRLLGVIEAPTLRPDGSILNEPGYDSETCLYFDPGGTGFPAIPDQPTREDALQALAVLAEPLKDFPWVAPSDRSGAIAAILTALVRHSLRAAPLTAFRAPKMASGKSLLADVVAMVATGRVASVMSQGKDEDEDKKRMLAILVEGIQVACIDNIERPLGGAALCSVLTQETWRERILGKTGTATVPTAVTWLATGNNLHFVGDITTRVVPSDLDPRHERPEERVFDVDLHEFVPANRGALVVAGLTILRAYYVAGRPDQHLPVFGRFEQWSGWIRSALVWLGEDDPCAGRHRIEEMDPVRRQLSALLLAWYERYGGKNVTAANVITEAAPLQDAAPSPFWQVLIEIAVGRGGRPDSRRLGNYLAKYERRLESGLRIERVSEKQGVALWRVEKVFGPPPQGREAAEGLVGPPTPAILDRQGRLVGSEGYEGESAPVGSEIVRRPPVLGGEKRANGPGPSGKDPRNPHNPSPGGTDGEEAE